MEPTMPDEEPVLGPMIGLRTLMATHATEASGLADHGSSWPDRRCEPAAGYPSQVLRSNRPLPGPTCRRGSGAGHGGRTSLSCRRRRLPSKRSPQAVFP